MPQGVRREVVSASLVGAPSPIWKKPSPWITSAGCTGRWTAPPLIRLSTEPRPTPRPTSRPRWNRRCCRRGTGPRRATSASASPGRSRSVFLQRVHVGDVVRSNISVTWCCATHRGEHAWRAGRSAPRSSIAQIGDLRDGSRIDAGLAGDRQGRLAVLAGGDAVDLPSRPCRRRCTWLVRPIQQSALNILEQLVGGLVFSAAMFVICSSIRTGPSAASTRRGIAGSGPGSASGRRTASESRPCRSSSCSWRYS